MTLQHLLLLTASLASFACVLYGAPSGLVAEATRRAAQAETPRIPAAADTPRPGDPPAPTSTPQPTATRSPTRTPEPESEGECPGALPQRLEAGDTGRVTFSNGLPVRVRDQPGVSGTRVLGQMPEGTHFTVTGGPVCEDGWWWWRLRSANGLVGWSAEGDRGMGYFLEVYPP